MRRGAGPVSTACRGNEFGCVRVIFVDTCADPPAGGLFGVVAAFAGPKPVVRAGRAAVGPGVGMVAVSDRRVTVGGAATLIAQLDEGGQTAGNSRARDSIDTSAPA